METNEEFISFENEKYIVFREFEGTTYKFGEFNSLDLALEFRKKINDDGWPIKKDTPILNKSKKSYIKEFIDKKIIQTKRDVKENDPSINLLYKNFKIFIENENIHISLKTFKYYFPRLINKNFIKREFINGTSRYNVILLKDYLNTINSQEKPSKIEHYENKKNTNKHAEEKNIKVLHGKNEIIPRLNEFFKDNISIKNKETTENDPTLDEISREFNIFLKKYDEKVNIKTLSNYFATIFDRNKYAQKLVINGKTHYNIIFNKNQEKIDAVSTSFKVKHENINTDKKTINLNYNFNINEINDISLICLEGSCEFIYFDALIEIFKKIKEETISLKINIKNDIIIFEIKLVELNSKKDTLINKIKSLMNL